MTGVCLLAGVMHRLSMIRTLMKSKTYFLAGRVPGEALKLLGGRPRLVIQIGDLEKAEYIHMVTNGLPGI
ncbi:hypothetical protein EYF80_065912 [Liparis tanakae]|uniref:Uncharacterized protein n=1 Tax=Liparis tanakae TaxID=230148 RepID=A0A4Z2E4X2_9TELE|nr:hypothetical protein EYF80_065912 [Liparis tanakae]